MSDDPTTISDRAIADAVNGDKAAIETVWRAWNPRLLRFFRARWIDEADDLAATVWLEIARKLPDFEGDAAAFRRWLFTVAHRRLIDAARYRARQPIVLELVDDDRVAELGSHVADLDWAIGLLKQLPDDQATAFALRVLADLDPAEVGEIMGHTAGSVRVLTHRAKNRLVELLSSGEQPLAEKSGGSVTQTGSQSLTRGT